MGAVGIGSWGGQSAAGSLQTTMTWTHNVSDGELVVAFIGFAHDAYVPTVTLDSVPMTLAGSNQYTAVYWVRATSAGYKDVVVASPRPGGDYMCGQSRGFTDATAGECVLQPATGHDSGVHNAYPGAIAAGDLVLYAIGESGNIASQAWSGNGVAQANWLANTGASLGWGYSQGPQSDATLYTDVGGWSATAYFRLKGPPSSFLAMF